MVIGHGMIANAFKKADISNHHHIIFASGVSNSLETNNDVFKKERDLLLSYSAHHEKLIYFSTVSVFDPSLQNTSYIRHKLQIENIITQQFSNYLIIRLPIVIGKSQNPNTLINFLYNRLMEGLSFELYIHATRYLIDLDDVVHLTSEILQKIHQNTIIDLVLDNKTPVPVIFEMLSKITGKSLKYIPVSKGADYSIDNTIVKKLIGAAHFKIDHRDYVYSTLKKYFGTP